MKLHAWVRPLAVAAAVLVAGCGGGGGGTAPGADPEDPAPGTPPAEGTLKTSYQLFKESGLVPQPTRRVDNARTYLDVDGDGKREVFSANLRYNVATDDPATAPKSVFRFFRESGGTTVEDATLLPDGNEGCVHPRKAVLSDFNGDGKLDIFVACHGFDAAPFPGETNKVVLSRADGTYVIQDASPVTGFFHSVAAADFDSDGDIDVVLADSSIDPSIQVWLNDGKGAFTRSTLYVPNELRRRANFFTVDVPDVDGDGRFDLFVGGHEWEGAPTTVYINPGDNDFTNVTGDTLPDVPGEGVVLDIVVTGKGVDRTMWVLRTSGGPAPTPFYESITVQKVLWEDLSSTLAMNLVTGAPPFNWVDWIIPARIGGVDKIVSDVPAETRIDIPY